LAGILVAPLVNLDALTLTLLIVDAFAAAMVGRLKSLPLTCVGALGLGLINAYGVGYMPQTDFMNRCRLGLPTIFLFVVLLVMPARRLRAGRAIARRLPSPPRLPTAAVTAAGFALLIAVLASVLSIDNQIHLGEALAFGFIMLSLVLLTGYGGQVSLCQLTFVGLGSFMAGLGGALLGGLPTGVGAGNFALLQSLVVLLLVTLGGVTSVAGALLGGVFLAGLPVLQSHLPSALGQLTFLGTGLGAISLGRNQDGAAGQIAANLRRVWSIRPPVRESSDQARTGGAVAT